MKLAIRDLQALRAVTPLDLAAYLRARSWARSPQSNGKAAVWTFGDEEIAVPHGSEVADYARRVAEAIAIVAEVEGRSEVEVWRDITTATFDLIRIRAEGDEQAQGSIRIDEGVCLVQRSRELLLAAACAAEAPRAVYHTRKPPAAIEYLERVRLGQTEVGSYVVTLLSPVPPALQTSLPAADFGDDSEPFEREVTRTLMRSLYAMNEAARDAASKGEFGPFEQAVERGVSANLCEAVVDLYELARPLALDVAVSWAVSRPLRDATAAPARVRIARDVVEPLKEASRVFRSRQPQRGVEVAGYVVKLEREEGAAIGHATVFARVAGTGPHRRVRMELPHELYQAALKAHGAGLAVRVIGELRREARGYALHGVREVVPDEDAADE